MFFCIFFSYAGTLNGDYVGFDWFAASIFLLMRGSLKKTWDYLKLFSTLLLSGYLWTPRLHLSVRIFPASQSHSHSWFENGPSISEHNWRSILKSVVCLFIRIHVYIQYILNTKNCDEIFEWDTYAIHTLFNFCSRKMICLITWFWFVCTYEHNFCHVCV